MSPVKRERWTENDIDALPVGEHDYFERKSGLLFNDTGQLLGTLAKAISAFANSGGGHIVLGVEDSGIPDGVPPTRGHTPIREWMEQKIPHLVTYSLSDFRVHVVERSTSSRITTDREVIVIDLEIAPSLLISALPAAETQENTLTTIGRRAGRSPRHTSI